MSQSTKLHIANESDHRGIVENYLNQMHDEPRYTPEEEAYYRDRIKRLLVEKNAVIVAHYYTDAVIQQLAEETGGFVSDSLEMARFGSTHSASTLVVAGVKFMGETAKILTPEKTVLMPTLEATCSLDIGCPAEDFAKFCDQHPDRTVVVYANTSAAVKARADWVVTSSIALDVVDYLDSRGEKILWAPDKYLGSYVQKKQAPTCCCGMAAVLSTKSLNPVVLPALKSCTRMRPFWCIPSPRRPWWRSPMRWVPLPS